MGCLLFKHRSRWVVIVFVERTHSSFHLVFFFSEMPSSKRRRGGSTDETDTKVSQGHPLLQSDSYHGHGSGPPMLLVLPSVPLMLPCQVSGLLFLLRPTPTL